MKNTTETMLARLDERTIKILENTERTNGRVSKLEEKTDVIEERTGKLETWQHVLQGQWKVVVVVIGILSSVLGFLVKHWLF